MNISISHPHLVKQWHPTKNGTRRPEEFSHGSGYTAWWVCEKAKDHVWPAKICKRTRKHIPTGCPMCSNSKVVESNCLATTHPELSKQWDYSKNKITPKEVTRGSNEKIYWICEKGHSFLAEISKKTRKDQPTGCRFCSGKERTESNKLSVTHPELMMEWHKSLNTNDPNQLGAGSAKKVWWQCSRNSNHVWKSSIYSRATKGTKCEYCSGRKATSENCLKTTHPEIAKEFHPNRNGKHTPETLVSGSHIEAIWVCQHGHEWKAKVKDRSTGGKKCPYCKSLGVRNPEIAKEWHQIKNDKTPYDVTPGSGERAWWICSKRHEWPTIINHRYQDKSGCPYCYNPYQSLNELMIIFELQLIFPEVSEEGSTLDLKEEIIRPDILIPELKICIEYDGEYYHSDRLHRDTEKTQMMIDNGYQVIRIREKPLASITKNDVLIKKLRVSRNNGKILVDQVLKKVVELCTLDAKTQKKVDEYLEYKFLQRLDEAKSYRNSLKIR